MTVATACAAAASGAPMSWQGHGVGSWGNQVESLRLKWDLIRLRKHRDFFRDHLLAVVEPPGQLAIDEAVEPFLVGPRPEPVPGLLAISAEISICEALEATFSDLAEVLDPVPPERLAPAC